MTHPITIVLDLSGGVLQIAYSSEPIDIIVISHDSDDVAEAERDPDHLAHALDGEPCYLSGHSASVEPGIVAHYLNEQQGA